MNFFLETVQVLLLSIWYNVESFIHLFVPTKKKNISGEVVLITGAGSGIGRLMAQEFAALGTVLVLWDINQEGMKETARLAKQSGASRVHYYLCDCSDKNEVYRVADQVKREVGDISILVNNAGIVTGKKFMDAPDSLIEKTVEVNTMAHFWTYKAFLPAMIANNHGHLVSIASSAGLIGVNGLADYCASKFAAVGFAESVGLELLATGKDGIKTTIVCPYFINTGMFDGCQTKWPRLMPILNPDYVAKKVIHAVLTDQVYLLLPRSMYLIAALKKLEPLSFFFFLLFYPLPHKCSEDSLYTQQMWFHNTIVVRSHIMPLFESVNRSQRSQNHACGVSCLKHQPDHVLRHSHIHLYFSLLYKVLFLCL